MYVKREPKKTTRKKAIAEYVSVGSYSASEINGAIQKVLSRVNSSYPDVELASVTNVETTYSRGVLIGLTVSEIL